MTVTDASADAPTVTDAPADASADAAGVAHRRGGLFAIIATVIIVAGAAIAWAAWAVLSQTALGGVSVVYDSQPVVCTGTTVENTPIAVHGEYRRPMIILDDDMVCELRIQVVNDGWSSVNVDAITLTGLWDENTTGVVVTMINPNGQQHVEDEAGARFDMGTFAIPAGEAQAFSAVLEYNGEASMVPCAGQGWNIPAATISTLGATREIQPPPRDDIWVHLGSSQECGTAEE